MNRPRILIVDDDANLLALIRVLLNKMGSFDTFIEHRSFAALATARAFCPDLILLDVEMPGKDGGDIAAELGMDPILSKVPIVFLTSLISQNEAGMRNGTRFLSKPVSPQVLLQTVREALPKAA